MELSAILAAVPTAAVITIATNWIFRRLDRPQAVFFAESLGLPLSPLPSSDVEAALLSDPPSKSFTLTNSGDASAYLLHVQRPEFRTLFLILDKSDARRIRVSDTVSSVAPGDTVNLLTWAPDEEGCSLKVTWLRSPVRHNRFEQQIITLDSPRNTNSPTGLPKDYRPQVEYDSDRSET
ncbi:MAG: hypothetical protein ACTH2U_08460 [Brevibacterium sp.]